MKTQLLEDIDDSRGLPVRSRPAVWHRPRFDAGPAAPPARPVRPDPVSAGFVRPPEAPESTPSSGPASPSASEPADAAAAPSQAQASGFGPKFEPRRAAPGMAPPHWLAEILRQDAQDAAAARRSPARMPRVLAWGAAACALALLAAGGLWLFEERRADGALMVVAESAPAPAAAAPRALPLVASAPVVLPARPLPATAAPVMVPAVPAAPVADAGAEPVPLTSRPAPDAQADQPVAVRVARREHAPVRATVPSKRRADPESGEQKRREETLVQCQAHGYDEQQCMERACELTRYGLACRG